MDENEPVYTALQYYALWDKYLALKKVLSFIPESILCMFVPQDVREKAKL